MDHTESWFPDILTKLIGSRSINIDTNFLTALFCTRLERFFYVTIVIQVEDMLWFNFIFPRSVEMVVLIPTCSDY